MGTVLGASAMRVLAGFYLRTSHLSFDSHQRSESFGVTEKPEREFTPYLIL